MTKQTSQETEIFKTRYGALPIDNRDNPVPLVPSRIPLKFTYLTSISTSQEITLDVDTAILEVTAIDGNVFLRYGTDNAVASTDNAHAFIPAGGTRHYILPPNITAINLIDNGDSAKVIVIQQ